MVLIRALLFLLLLSAFGARASDPPASSPPVDVTALLPLEWESNLPLVPFVGTYTALYRGKPAGDATLALKELDGAHWEVSLEVRGKRGFAGVLGLNLLQTTQFERNADNQFRPLNQRTVRRGLFLGKAVEGQYDWQNGIATWSGDIDRKRRAPVSLQPGDLSALLINLAVIRDALPNARLSYRFADAGRSRLYTYQVADAPDSVTVNDLNYSALRVWRTNANAGDAMEIWIANGVPTPVKISQWEDGQPGIELQLVEYHGG